jgi:hypothetical protein
MLLAIILILLGLWVLGFLVFHVAGVLIHLLLVVAVIVVLIRIIQGKRVL